MENGGEPQAEGSRGWALACTIAGSIGVVVFVFVGLVAYSWINWLWVALLVPYTAINWAKYRRLKGS
ncbi:hypothetical protein M8542_44320 [Amycolatopsis sp. OK19-0408]|uniref:Uncharacterized protein n=1 Tax=Amycolatopsis iheyensis TaxID=2945988 RepID=A0A9X2NN00_9PSEU|nr:hypothetical protein [Amycolatopsis iheyensis]MCR6489860.1 hypothetical protein [Amycolatopsis iheyensis]